MMQEVTTVCYYSKFVLDEWHIADKVAFYL